MEMTREEIREAVKAGIAYCSRATGIKLPEGDLLTDIMTQVDDVLDNNCDCGRHPHWVWCKANKYDTNKKQPDLPTDSVECPNCEGWRTNPGTSKPCFGCYGSGIVSVEQAEFLRRRADPTDRCPSGAHFKNNCQCTGRFNAEGQLTVDKE